MTDRREHTAIRLSPAALEKVRALATEETEGNVSAMLRKLLGEALNARIKQSTQDGRAVRKGAQR